MEKSYIPKKFNQWASIYDTNGHLDNQVFEYYHRWREPTRTWRSQTQEIDFEAEKAALPKNHHAHAPQSKYDVAWTEDQKFPHVADRLGYPILSEEPIEKIFGIERAPAHPGFQFQPFVQTPSFDPDPTLNFELGETIYENKKVSEWIKFWRTLGAITLPFWPAFYVFEVYGNDHVPSLDWAADVGNWATLPK